MRSVVVMLMLVFSVPGCKRIEERIAQRAMEKTVEAATGANVDPASGEGTVTLTGEHGAVVAVGGDAVTVPASWPASVPPYPSATLKGSMSLAGSQAGGKLHDSLTYETADQPSQVLAYYAANLKGFTKTHELNVGGNVVASFEGDGKVVALTVSRGQNSKVSMLNLLVTNKT